MSAGLPSGIDRLPSGKYRARYRCTGCKSHPAGPGQHSESFTKLKDSTDWRTKQLAAVNVGHHVDPNAGRITFKEYAEQWLKVQGFDHSTHEAVELRLRLHASPTLGRMPLRSITSSHIRTWVAGMTMAPSYRRSIFTNVSSVFTAAVDDGVITKNPCAARSVRTPKVEARKVIPWPVESALKVHDNLPDRFKIVATLGLGLGLRQGEVFGLSPDDVDFLRGTVEVRRQVKVYGGNRLAFALPKGGKTRTVPLPASVRDELAQHLAKYPAQVVALPWALPTGDPVEVALVNTNRESKALNRNYFNTHVWKPALLKSGIKDTRDNGMHALRHLFASVLLDAGENIRALADYLGHSDPGFTLKVYTHLMPTSNERTRKAVDAAFASRVTAVSLTGESVP